MINRYRSALLAACLVLVAPLAQAADDPDALRLSQRLQALDADPATADVAAYERLQARQAVGALAIARSRARGAALQVAEQRVETAELSAHTQLTRREIDKLDSERSDLLVEASRQDAARARQESERLRVQAQIQAEETQRLRQQADEASMAQQEAETTLQGVAGDQTVKLRAARKREAELARREAELMQQAPPADDDEGASPPR